MNKKIIPLAALVAMAGGMNAAHAVNVNNDGLGEVLLFPFYSVVDGNDTTINIVNTTNEVKAVKVRFIEGMNSKEVLDFNLYLSPFDHWSGVITADGDGALFKTADTSCTVPALPAAGQPFNPVLFAADSNNGVQRTREGYIEVIEMGVVTDGANTFATDATHVAGVPADCASLLASWGGGGAWLGDPTIDMTPNTGGLYGYSFLLNVNAGTAAAYDATALDAFADPLAILHARPGDSSPALSDAAPTATVIDNAVVTTVATLTNLDAVSAVIMHDTISNDFVLEPTINAGTDWVITFPTKHDYVQIAPATAPFINVWDPTTSLACEEIAITYYDREELPQTPAGVDFSPRPPAGSFALCAEANVLTFNSADVLNSQVAGNIATNLNLVAGTDNGWMTIGFGAPAGAPAGSRELAALGATFGGLPVLGFAVQKYVNSTLVVGGVSVLSNYAGSVEHKATRNIF